MVNNGCPSLTSPGITVTFAKGFPDVIPVPGVRYLFITHPSATIHSYCYKCIVRLACLSHAASVRSEPGSNSSLYLSIYDRRITPTFVEFDLKGSNAHLLTRI